MKLVLALILLGGSAANAASFTYKCNSSGSYKSDGFFADGFAVLKVNKSGATLEKYDVNPNDRETVKAAKYVFDIVGKKEGSSKVAGYMVGDLDLKKSDYSGDGIDTVYLEETLLKGGHTLKNGKRGGLLTFTGHGYSWDWNLCVRQ